MGSSSSSPSAAPTARVVGEVCFDATQGEPYLVPYFSSGPDSWAAVGQASSRAFTVFALDGRRDGVFHLDDPVATDPPDKAHGRYDGWPAYGPCVIAKKELRRGQVTTFSDASCRGCGLGVAQTEGGDDNKDGVRDIAAACVEKRTLIVDIDGDGKNEAFPLDMLFDSGTAAESLDGAAAGAFKCEMRFAVWQGTPSTTKVDETYVDILGVADFDGDGRREIVIAIRSPKGRTVATYRAASGAIRLDRVAAAAR